MKESEECPEAVDFVRFVLNIAVIFLHTKHKKSQRNWTQTCKA
jgi:hypothetical protein